MLILGLETSCDETAAAVVEDGRIIRSNIIASQHDIHAEYAGVVPELASRAHAERILPIVRGALREAGISLGQGDAPPGAARARARGPPSRAGPRPAARRRARGRGAAPLSRPRRPQEGTPPAGAD